jgi:hypothetical protein
MSALCYNDVQDMVDYLRQLDPERLLGLQKGVRAVRSKFLYMPLPGRAKEETASHVLLAEMCQRINNIIWVPKPCMMQSVKGINERTAEPGVAS